MYFVDSEQGDDDITVQLLFKAELFHNDHWSLTREVLFFGILGFTGQDSNTRIGVSNGISTPNRYIINYRKTSKQQGIAEFQIEIHKFTDAMQTVRYAENETCTYNQLERCLQTVQKSMSIFHREKILNIMLPALQAT